MCVTDFIFFTKQYSFKVHMAFKNIKFYRILLIFMINKMFDLLCMFNCLSVDNFVRVF